MNKYQFAIIDNEGFIVFRVTVMAKDIESAETKANGIVTSLNKGNFAPYRVYYALDN